MISEQCNRIQTFGEVQGSPTTPPAPPQVCETEVGGPRGPRRHIQQESFTHDCVRWEGCTGNDCAPPAWRPQSSPPPYSAPHPRGAVRGLRFQYRARDFFQTNPFVLDAFVAYVRGQAPRPTGYRHPHIPSRRVSRVPCTSQMPSTANQSKDTSHPTETWAKMV